MTRFRWFQAGAAVLAACFAQAQTVLPPDANLFDGSLRELQNNGRTRPKILLGAVAGTDASRAAADYGQKITFTDGRELSGELMEVTKEEIRWRRADASEMLRFPLAEIRRITTTTNSEHAASPGISSNQKGAEKPTRATLKLPGGDWLFGEATSVNGHTFDVKFDETAHITIAREQIEWLYLAQAPAPALGFSGAALDMEGWSPPAAFLETSDATLTVAEAAWVGHSLPFVKRLEISFELPEDSEEGTRLWMQPSFAPQPNIYWRGTIVLRFGPKEISRIFYVNDNVPRSSPVPDQVTPQTGSAAYRIFYDDGEKRLILFRNGRQIGDWKDFEKGSKDNDPGDDRRDFHIAGICFDREDRGQDTKALKLRRLRVQPWDGVIPRDGGAARVADSLCIADSPSVTGRLESLLEKELRFAGETHPVAAGTLIQFPDAISQPLACAEVRLDFGTRGEFVARHLEIRGNLLHCETSFASSLEVPMAALRNIQFPPAPANERPPAAMLVFKNGDELSGQALAATWGAPVRWRTSTAQDIEFQSGRVAGLRLAPSEDGASTRAAEIGSTVELRSGDRLRGRLLTLDATHLRIHHSFLGVLTLERESLWRLFTDWTVNADSSFSMGGWGWMNEGGRGTEEKKRGRNSDRWISLDGTYILRTDGGRTSYNTADVACLQKEIHPALERFEVRLEALSSRASPACFLLSLTGQNGVTLNATFTYSNLNLVFTNVDNQPQPRWRQIPFGEKIDTDETRRSLRLFVDTRAGTTDIVINGVVVARLGQNQGERLLQSIYTLRIQPYPNQGGLSMLSNFWIGPWDGELPLAGLNVEDHRGKTALLNGDIIAASPKGIEAGRLRVDSELGELDLPVEQVSVVEFASSTDRAKPAARVRLTDGSKLNVDAFQWDGRELTAHSTLLGNLRLPASAVAELIYAPAPWGPPTSVSLRRLAKKDADESTISR